LPGQSVFLLATWSVALQYLSNPDHCHGIQLAVFQQFVPQVLSPDSIDFGINYLQISLLGSHSVLARLSPHTIRVCNLRREKINLLSYEAKIPKMGSMGLNVLIPVPPEKPMKNHKTWDLAKAQAWISARVVGTRTIKGTMIWVLTTLNPEQISDPMVLELYRLRWQVELLFKRLKSLLHIDALPTRDGPTAKSWILARLLAATVAQKMVQPSIPFFPKNGHLCA
jgi:hypothetical protein